MNITNIKLRAGDTLSGVIFNMFGYGINDRRYSESEDYLLNLNPHIKNRHLIKVGDILRLGVLQPITTSKIQTNETRVPTFVTTSVNPHNMENFWALAWLEKNANYLTVPGGIALGAKGNLLSPGNIGLINSVNDHYADYKSGRISKAQYDYRRKLSLDRLKTNIGPFEKWLFGKNTTHESIRIARSGGVPATTNITRHANKLNRLATLGKTGGFVLVGVGLTASCMQIAKTKDIHEKNEIFVETISSTTVGIGVGTVIGLFLVSNPIGWGTAIVFAVGSSALSYGAGKIARYSYDKSGTRIDFVSGLGIRSICQ